MLKVNLGAGAESKEGYVNVDIYKQENIDLVHDLTKPLPFKKNSIDVLYSRHSIEHYPQHLLLSILEDWWEKSKDGAIWTIIVPYAFKLGETITHHTMGWNEGSFNEYCINKTGKHWYSKMRFEMISCEARTKAGKTRFVDLFFPLNVQKFRRFLSGYGIYLNEEIEFNLKVVKNASGDIFKNK